MTKKNKNKNKNKNPYKSWRKYEWETWFQYIDRILTYNRLQLIIGGISLIFTILSFYITRPPKEIELLKRDIENHLATIENNISREKVTMDNDSTEYNKLINNFKIDILDYIGIFKAVSDSELSEEYVNLYRENLKEILKNEYERRIQLGEFAYKLFEDIAAIRTYEYLTDTSYVTKISVEKQTKILGLLKKQNLNDSLHWKNIIAYLEQANSNLKYKKGLRKAIREMSKMTKNKLWYTYHKSIMEFIIETNNLYEISKRKFSLITPYKYLDDVMINKLSQTNTIDRETIRELLLQILNNDLPE